MFVALLPWLPILGFLLFLTVPRSEVLVCDAQSCVLESQRGLSTQRAAVLEVAVEKDEDSKRPTLMVQANGVAHYDLGDRVTPAFDAYQESRRTKTPLRLPVGGRAWWWMLGVIVALELVILGGYALGQRAITFEVTPETGRLRILERKRGRTRELTAFDLGDIEELELEDLDEEAMSRAVVVKLRGKKRRRIFDAMNIEAQRGFDFLEEARAAWTDRATPS